MTKQKIREYFEEAIRLNQTLDSELKRQLMKHERANLFIDNMVDEMVNAANICLFKRGKMISDKVIKETVYSMTDVFISSVKMEADKRSESVLARLAREAEIQNAKDLEATYNGKPSGDYEELIEGE